MHTPKAAGIFWLNLFMLQFLEKTALKAAHHFCMRGDDWSWISSLRIFILSHSILIFCLPVSTMAPLRWLASSVNCGLCSSPRPPPSPLILQFSDLLDKWVIKALRREQTRKDKSTLVWSYTGQKKNIDRTGCLKKSSAYKWVGSGRSWED